jgi:hypothetical protein
MWENLPKRVPLTWQAAKSAKLSGKGEGKLTAETPKASSADYSADQYNCSAHGVAARFTVDDPGVGNFLASRGQSYLNMY